MQKIDRKYRLSPTDLTKFAACEHQSALDLRFASGEDLSPREPPEELKLVADLGTEHEKEFLEELRSKGKQIVEIERSKDLDKDVWRTLAAMQGGAEVIYQGTLKNGSWAGYTDFLLRVDEPSELGDYSYEVIDSKLKRKPDPSHIIQLVIYSHLVGLVQGRLPTHMHVQLGNGIRSTHTVREFADYVLQMQGRLEEFVAKKLVTRPVPCKACGSCRWKDKCDVDWRQDNSLFLVAGIRRTQVAKLEAAGIKTLETLARHEGEVPRLASTTLETLREQARLQHEAQTTNRRIWKLRQVRPGKGYYLLPTPSSGDLFYDIEGYPHYAEAGQHGLEYLHGVWNGNGFSAFWAHNLAEEREALIGLFELFSTHLKPNLQAHIYHYAPYEITALRKITARHGYGEDILDTWLREERFVDLYAVVRGGIVVSEPGYSIKNLEAFYRRKRREGVKEGGASVVAYSKWIAEKDEEKKRLLLANLEEYNKVDCISTQELRDWLWARRPDLPLSTGTVHQSSEAKQRAATKEAEFASVGSVIDGASRFGESARYLMNNLIRFHSREAKPAAWKVFDSRNKQPDDLLRDTDYLAALQPLGEVFSIKRSMGRQYRYAPQSNKVRTGSKMQIKVEDDNFGFRKVDVVEHDRRQRTVTLKISKRHARDLVDRLDLLPNFAVPSKVIQKAIWDVLKHQCTDGSIDAARDLLTWHEPRFRDGWTLAQGSADALERLLQATSQLDNSVLPVQGPPGTGKTYVTARAILSLVNKGKQVAVASNSHAAIINVLEGCAIALDENYEGLRGAVTIAHKIGQRPTDRKREDAIYYATKNDDPALMYSNIVGGTAWLFCRDEFSANFDYLFVDEAGQVSLANLVGMTSCAANVVLVGDPCQLPQVIQGAHPPPANLSCLEWMLQGMRMVSEDRGIFLPDTYRMHPKLCRFISAQFYENKLKAHATTARQAVHAPGIPTAGAYRVDVVHEGRSQECAEEAEAIRVFIDALLQGTWTNKKGRTRPLQTEDIIVVAPFNAQVNRLTDELEGIRVGTVDKFQGQEAPVALLSMTSSSAEETPRGLEFVFSRERINVAMSRGQALSIAFASPKLLQAQCSTVNQIRMMNPLCALESIALP